MLRLSAEYDSKLPANNVVTKYLIEIFDESYSGSDDVIKCSANGYNPNRESEEKTFPQFVMPTYAEVSFNVTDQNVYDFFAGLGTVSESGLILKVTDRDTSSIKHIGRIIPDLLTIADEEIQVGVDVKIKSVDGLALLRDIPYIDTQAADFFFQINDHKIRAEIASTVTQNGSGASFSETLFNEEIEDPGDRYDPITGIYTSGGVTGDWAISLIVHAKPSNDFEDVTGKIIKIATDLTETIVAEERITFREDGITQRLVLSVQASDVDLADGEKIKARIEWQDDWHFISFEKGSSFFNTIRGSKYNLKNVYDSAINHIKNLLQATGLQDEYGATDTFFNSVTKWNESTQPATTSILDYLNLPFNAFISNYSTFPVTTLSCFDCLEAICRSLGAFLTYEDGVYLFVQYDSLLFNDGVDVKYQPDFTVKTTATYSDTPTEPKRLPGGNFTYMPSIRDMSISFVRWNTPNFLWGAWGVFPNGAGDIYTNEYVKSGETVKWICKIKFLNNPAPFPGFTGGSVAHSFTVRFKIGDYWLKFDQLSDFTSYNRVHYPGTIGVPATWEDTLQINTLMFPFIHIQEDAPIERIVIGQANGAAFDIPPESGPLEFHIEYNTTYHGDANGDLTDTVLALDYEWLDFQFLNTDEADNIIEETVRTSFLSSGSSESLNIPIIFSDRNNLEQDPGNIKIDNGTDLVDPANFSDGVTSYTFQKFITNFYASLTTNRIKIYNGVLMLDGPKMLNLIDGDKFFSMKSSYDTVYNDQSGTYTQIEKFAVTGSFSEVIGQIEEGSTNVAGTLPSSTSGTADPVDPTIAEVNYITGFTNLNNLTEYTPYNYDLNELATVDDINKILSLKLSGRELHHPTHYTIDLTGAAGKIIFSRPIALHELLTWKILDQ